MGGKKYFTLSFDDGVEQDKKLIALMKQFGLFGTFNISAGMFGKTRQHVDIQQIPKDEIKQVYAGFEVASHGYRHELYSWMPAKKIQASLARDIKELSEVVGYKVVGHAYPYGAHTKTAEVYFRENGILYARRAQGKGSFYFPKNSLQYIPTCWVNDKNVLSLLNEFIRAEPAEDDLLFMMWGHAHEMDYGFRRCSEEQLKRIFSKIAGKTDIVYCTNKDAFESQRKNIQAK